MALHAENSEIYSRLLAFYKLDIIFFRKQTSKHLILQILTKKVSVFARIIVTAIILLYEAWNFLFYVFL